MGWFGKRETRERPETAAPGGEPLAGDTLLGRDMTVRGTVSGEDPVRFNGKLEGDFRLGSDLHLLGPSTVKGTVKGRKVTVEGTVEGELTATDRLHVEATARVTGKIATPLLSVKEGAKLEGEVRMGGK